MIMQMSLITLNHWASQGRRSRCKHEL